MPRSRDKTRVRILQASYRLFRQKGFTRVNVDEIAAAADVTKRTLYSHFESKDALLAEVLRAQHEQSFSAFQTIGKELSGTPASIICRQIVAPMPALPPVTMATGRSLIPHSHEKLDAAQSGVAIDQIDAL